MVHSTTSSPSVLALSKARAMTNDITRDYSLDRIGSDLLSRADAEASGDLDLSHLLETFRVRLAKKKGPDDVISSSQAFETFGEIKTYRHLKNFGFSPKYVPTVPNKRTPDFECKTPDDLKFYVEVKSFDIVNGEFAQTTILSDGLDARINLEKQQNQGERVAISEQAISPYGEKIHSGSQVQGVIDTIGQKISSNFKQGQFNLGPTFAVAILDKLIVPGRQCALSPYYHEEIFQGSACVSGTLWASAYGQPGNLLLDAYEFEGKPTNSGISQKEGYFTEHLSHPAQGIIFFDQAFSNPLVYGLVNGYAAKHSHWSMNKTEHVLDQICDAWNCETNANGYTLANYDSRQDFPIGVPSKSSWDY